MRMEWMGIAHLLERANRTESVMTIASKRKLESVLNGLGWSLDSVLCTLQGMTQPEAGGQMSLPS
jgi:hypothetical protein